MFFEYELLFLDHELHELGELFILRLTAYVC